MKHLLSAILLAAVSLVAAAADLTPAQRMTFLAAINAETDAGLVACRQARDDGCIAAYYNAPTATLAWRDAVASRDVFEAMNLTSFDGLSAGKREVMRLLLAYEPVDFTRDKTRAALVDVWGVADTNVILAVGTTTASRFEMLYGGTSATSEGVTALKRVVVGTVTLDLVSALLNNGW